MIDTTLLNENQKEAVLSDDQYLRIIAGAGSGKTRVLTTRIVHLIEDEDVRPYKILAITMDIFLYCSSLFNSSCSYLLTCLF